MTEKKVYKPNCCTECTFADECFSDIRIKCGNYETAIKEYYRGLSEGLEEGCVKARELEKENKKLRERLNSVNKSNDEYEMIYRKSINEHNENIQLKAQNENQTKYLENAGKRIEEFILQIEKMKNCRNCKNWNWKHSKCEKRLKGDCFKNSKWELAE